MIESLFLNCLDPTVYQVQSPQTYQVVLIIELLRPQSVDVALLYKQLLHHCFGGRLLVKQVWETGEVGTIHHLGRSIETKQIG